MKSNNEVIPRLENFLARLRNGDFSDNIADAFRQLNSYVERHQDAASHFRENYLPKVLRENRSGKHYIGYFTKQLTSDDPPIYQKTLAYWFTVSMIDLYAQSNDELCLESAVKLILHYELVELISVESTGQNLKFDNGIIKFPITISLIRPTYQTKLLSLIVKKYSALLARPDPDRKQDFPGIVQRFNFVLLLLSKFYDKEALLSFPVLQPFGLTEEISFQSQTSLRIFGQELKAEEYDEYLYRSYRIPLFPYIQSDAIKLQNSKFSFVNEGKGVLPAFELILECEQHELHIGHLPRPVLPGSDGELYLDDVVSIREFLSKNSNSRNSDVKLNFRFQKFGHQYDFIVLSKTVGSWLEAIEDEDNKEIAQPYNLPIVQLSDRNFEQLCYWIVEEYKIDGAKRFKKVFWLNEDGGPERGRDIVAVEIATEKSFAFQCKRVEKFAPKDIEQELLKFEEHIKQDISVKPNCYVLVTSSALTDKTMSRGTEIAEQLGFEIDFWPKSTVDKLVRDYETVKNRFFRLV